jgi:hypothetical protein
MSQNGLKRWYVHGDAIEGKPEIYDCCSCDLFVDELHFPIHNNEPNIMNNLDKYKQGLKTWQAINKKRENNYRRPNNPSNLFN